MGEYHLVNLILCVNLYTMLFTNQYTFMRTITFRLLVIICLITMYFTPEYNELTFLILHTPVIIPLYSLM